VLGRKLDLAVCLVDVPQHVVLLPGRGFTCPDTVWSYNCKDDDIS
jgi:hypothetical protein